MRTIAVLIALSMAGGALKIYGSVVGSSRSVFVDAMTSIANTLSILMIMRFFSQGVEPPDEDHHYGHHRLALGGSISMLMLYSFVAGLVTVDLATTFGRGYSVGYESPIYAALALLPYGLAVLIAKRSHPIVAGYAGFTTVELIESFVSITASAGGAAINYVVDFAGALALTGYLFYELIESFKEVLIAISDVAPRDVVDKISSVVESRGLSVERIRVRRVLENVYYGDIVLKVPPGTSVEDAHSIADDIEKELSEYNIDVAIHIEPNGEGRQNTNG